MVKAFNVKLGFIYCIFYLCFGCAKTVTQKPVIGNTIQFSITFSSPPNFVNNNYYIIYDSADTIDINPNNNSNYFFIPGINFDNTILDNSLTSSLSTYYTDYFSSWGGVLSLTNLNIDIRKGPFPSTTFAALTPEKQVEKHLDFIPSLAKANDYKVIGNTISFSISVSSLGISSNDLYIKIVTTTADTASTGSIQNVLDLTIDSFLIELIANRAPYTGSNINLFPSSTGKIESWTISIVE